MNLPIKSLTNLRSYIVGGLLMSNGVVYTITSGNYAGSSGTNSIGVESNRGAKFNIPMDVFEDAFRGGSVAIDDIIIQAIKSYGRDDGVFSTACFQKIVENYSSQDVEYILSAHPRVVRLYGGSHWLLLPNDLNKF